MEPSARTPSGPARAARVLRHVPGPAAEEVEDDVRVLALRPVSEVVGLAAAEVGRAAEAGVGAAGETLLVVAPADRRC